VADDGRVPALFRDQKADAVLRVAEHLRHTWSIVQQGIE
jgi:hypothetical protein